MTGIPILPPSASSVSTEVDLLYFFLTGVTAFFVVLVGVLVVYFTFATGGAIQTKSAPTFTARSCSSSRGRLSPCCCPW